MQIRAYADLYRIISPKTKYRLSTVADDPLIQILVTFGRQHIYPCC